MTYIIILTDGRDVARKHTTTKAWDFYDLNTKAFNETDGVWWWEWEDALNEKLPRTKNYKETTRK
jgi:hypothetical protein